MLFWHTTLVATQLAEYILILIFLWDYISKSRNTNPVLIKLELNKLFNFLFFILNVSIR